MKLTVAAESPLERAALAFDIPPVPLMDTHLSFLRARAIMVATRLGVFDALASAPATAAAVASRCHTAPPATTKLLNALVGCGYLRFGGDRYRLAPVARKWLTSDSPHSIRDKVLFEFVDGLRGDPACTHLVAWKHRLVDHQHVGARLSQPPRA